MAGLQVTYYVNDASPKQALQAVMEAVSGPSLGMFLEHLALPHVQNDIQTQVELGGAGKWPPLKDSTMKIRDFYGFTPDDPNWRSGQMLDWLMDPSNSVTVVGPGSAVLSTPNLYSGGALNYKKLETAQRGRVEANQFGTGGVTETPPREVLVMREFTAAKIIVSLEEWVIAVVRSKMVL